MGVRWGGQRVWRWRSVVEIRASDAICVRSHAIGPNRLRNPETLRKRKKWPKRDGEWRKAEGSFAEESSGLPGWTGADFRSVLSFSSFVLFFFRIGETRFGGSEEEGA
jgi:hypothetical protein